jgi:poly(hydroxyalkanoate) depolymerase family esterase
MTIDHAGPARPDEEALGPLAASGRPAPTEPSAPLWLDRRGRGLDHRLFLPARTPVRGLILMLHGCRQDPESFAETTRMNAHAQDRGLAVVYPRQSRRANLSACWNWFDPAHQRADAGEPAVLAALVASVAREFSVPSDRLYVAGLSAGGAMAAVLAAAHPDLFAAVGVHSGVPAGVARGPSSAAAAMRGEAVGLAAMAPPPRRLILFHGAADDVVSCANGRAMFDAARDALPPGARAMRTTVAGPGARTALRRRAEAAGAAVELWQVEGGGHGWFGGPAGASFAEPDGPDASAEMVRFFVSG